MNKVSKKHSSGFHEEYGFDVDMNGSKRNGESSSARHLLPYRFNTSSPMLIDTISIEDSDEELDNNNEESSPDRHRRGFEDEEEIRHSNDTTKAHESDESEDDVVEISDDIEVVSRVNTKGKDGNY